MFDVTQLAFKFAWVLGAVFLIMIFYWLLRIILLGKCTRCGQTKSLGGKFCIKCGTQYGQFYPCNSGFFHSPFFAALLSILIVCTFYRKEVIFSNRWWKYLLYFFILAASHGLLDTLTNGGNGIALLSPFTNSRYFFPWTPIEVSPLSIKGFLSQRGLTVLISELLWIWAPCFFIGIFLKIRRNKAQVSERV